MGFGYNWLSGFDWLVGCFGFNGPLRQYFLVYIGTSPKEREKEEEG